MVCGGFIGSREGRRAPKGSIGGLRGHKGIVKAFLMLFWIVFNDLWDLFKALCSLLGPYFPYKGLKALIKALFSLKRPYFPFKGLIFLRKALFSLESSGA